jgi:hypothetical protein
MTTKKQARIELSSKVAFFKEIREYNSKRGHKTNSLKHGKNSITALESKDRNLTSFIRVNHSYAFILPQKYLSNYSQRQYFHLMSEILFKDMNPFNHVKILPDGTVQRVPFNPDTRKKISGSRNIRMNIVSEIKHNF